MKKFLENLKAESWTIGCQVLGVAVTGALYLESKEIGFLLGSICFGILLVSAIVAVLVNVDKNSDKNSEAQISRK